MKNKKILIPILIIFLIIFIIIFFLNNTYKSSKIVNTIDKSNIKEYILNISSYKATVTITINSNKNTNKYILSQQYADGVYKQEIIEPSNINGLTIIYDGLNLKLENTNINLSKVYEEYKYIAENSLDLYSFINDFKNKGEFIEKENEIIMKIQNETSRYSMYQNLYISKDTGLPTKMEIVDKNQNIIVYIEYNEINFNSTNKEDILAFSLDEVKVDL